MGQSKRIRFMFAWYDMWIGVFYDRAKRRLYIFPVPCFGVCIDVARYYAIVAPCIRGAIGVTDSGGVEAATSEDPDSVFMPISRRLYRSYVNGSKAAEIEINLMYHYWKPTEPTT